MALSIGFAGIGNMGWPMAARLVAAGHPVAVLDASGERMAAFQAEFGARSAASAEELARDADVLITIVPTSAVVEQVLAGERGALRALRPGSIVIDMSSGIPAETIRLAASVAAAGAAMIDAPVSGGVRRAVTGDLAIMAGGDGATIDRVMPVLSAMGSTITRTGGIGSAHAMKALNNLVSAAGLLASIEALLIGQKFGLDPALMVDVLNASTGMNNSTQKKLKPFVLSRAFDSGFGLDLMVKDLRIALGVARESGTAAPFSALCQELFAAAAASLGPGRDHTELARFSEAIGGAQLGDKG